MSRQARAFSTCALVRSALVFGLLPLLIGCSIHPLPDDVSRKTTYDIVEKIRCEAKAAVMQYGRGFKDASIVYNFSFDIKELNDASGGFTLFHPFMSGGAFSLTASAGAKRNRDGFRNFELLDSSTTCER